MRPRLATFARSLLFSSPIILSLQANAQDGSTFGGEGHGVNGTRLSMMVVFLALAAQDLWSANVTAANARARIKQVNAVHAVQGVRAHKSTFLASAAEVVAPPVVKTVTHNLTLHNVFHIIGVPGVRRNRRVDVIFNSQSLGIQQGKKQRLSVPFARIRRLEVLDGTRNYAKATYATILAGGVAGALLLLKKEHVDTLVFDYVNDRGGQMGLILQVPGGKGAACRDWLRRFGVAVEEPEPLPPAPPGNPPQ